MKIIRKRAQRNLDTHRHLFQKVVWFLHICVTKYFKNDWVCGTSLHNMPERLPMDWIKMEEATVVNCRLIILEMMFFLSVKIWSVESCPGSNPVLIAVHYFNSHASIQQKKQKRFQKPIRFLDSCRNTSCHCDPELSSFSHMKFYSFPHQGI